MLIVGELINASRKSIGEAIKKKDTQEIIKVARSQVDAGANYIDVNAGIFVDEESEYLAWLVETVQNELDIPCCIDSPSSKAIEAALEKHKGTPVINSISLEKGRFDELIPLIKGTDNKVVALCMDDTGMPETKDERMSIADAIVNRLVANDVPLDNIYVDPLVQPLSTRDDYGIEFLETVREVMLKFPGVHTICGLSNISFGLPARKLINQIFMIMAISMGLDAAVVNPLDEVMMANIIIAESLKGKDVYCEKLLEAFRAKKFEFVEKLK